MGTNNIGKWSASASLDARGVQTGAQQAIASAKGMESALEGIFGRMGAAVKFPGLSLGFENITTAIGLQAGRQFIDSFQRTVDENLELGFLSDRLGVDVSFVSALQTVAAEMNVNAETFSGGMDRLNQVIGQARMGSTEAREAFRGLGLEWESVTSRRFDVALMEVADAFSRLENRSERARLATELFGRGAGQRILRLFEGGQLPGALADVQSRGGFITSEGLQRLQEVDDTIDRLTTTWRNTWREFVITTAPALTSFFRGINGFVENIGAAMRIGSTGLATPPLPTTLPPANTLDEMQSRADFLRAELEQARGAEERARSAAAPQIEHLESRGFLSQLADTMSGLTHVQALTGTLPTQTFEMQRYIQAQERVGRATTMLADAEAQLAADRERQANADEQQRRARNRSAIEERQREMLRDIAEADQITAQNATPLETFNQRMSRLRELFEGGDISARTFERATGTAIDRLVPRLGASPLLGSLSAGSAETASIIQGAMSPQIDRLTEIAAGIESMIEEQRRTAELQEQLVEWFESGPGASLAAAIEA